MKKRSPQNSANQKKIRRLPDFLLWYRRNKRNLPWRKTRDPYRIWVSETMLQQTQVKRVVDFYHEFLEKFPDVGALAKASWPEVLSKVRGLGYYGRFRNMQKTAREILKTFRGKFPEEYETLRKLPGIGDYTARAIRAFVFDRDEAVVDTNVRRVLKNFYGKLTEKSLRDKALELCPKGRARDFFQALMDYAQKLPRDDAKSSARKSPRNDDAKTISVAAAIIRHQGKILIQQRKPKSHLGGLWEFPGGKKEPGEDNRACLKREIQEELGIEISVRPAFFTTTHRYPDRTVRISFHNCRILLGKAKPREGQKIQWISENELLHFRFAPADRPVITLLKTSAHRKSGGGLTKKRRTKTSTSVSAV